MVSGESEGLLWFDLIVVVHSRSDGSDSLIPFRRAHIAKEPLCLFKNNPQSVGGFVCVLGFIASGPLTSLEIEAQSSTCLK
jgi:hypothetical protein